MAYTRYSIYAVARKNDRFVSYEVCFSSSKIRQYSFFCRGSDLDPAGELTMPPQDPLVGWEGGRPLPIPSLLDTFGIPIWPPTSLKFVH